MAKSLVYRRLRAPRRDKSFLLEPSWAECLKLAESNARLFCSYDFDLHGRSFQSLRRSVRETLLRQSIAYTQSYLDIGITSPDADTPIVMSGHQPTLFHPGVWAKNFAIDRMAREVNGVAIQIVIDNDAMRSHSILCPTGTVAEPNRIAEPFDSYHVAIPYEMRYVQEKDVFKSFAGRVATHVKPFVADPLVTQFWPDACEAVEQGNPIGHAFARARHRLERRWGTRTLELPLSQLCDTDGFRWFAVHLFSRAREVQRSYNERLNQYRNVHRLRNPAQPLPDLRTQDTWTEAPFWVWTESDPRRQAVWIRETTDDLEIRGDAGGTWKLPGSRKTPENAINQLAQYRQNGMRLRPKALANTLFLRMFCADTFVHGIGGAKYDQVTDLLIHDLFDVPHPTFGALSLTALMPSSIPVQGVREIIHKRRQIREMYFHPERFLDDQIAENDQVSSKVKTKRKMLSEKPVVGSAAAWHRSIARVNAELRCYLQEKTDKEKKDLLRLAAHAKTSELFSSREWSFCLFEESFLRERLLDQNYAASYSSGAE